MSGEQFALALAGAVAWPAVILFGMLIIRHEMRKQERERER